MGPHIDAKICLHQVLLGGWGFHCLGLAASSEPRTEIDILGTAYLNLQSVGLVGHAKELL
jgi:hypothetical protein